MELSLIVHIAVAPKVYGPVFDNMKLSPRMVRYWDEQRHKYMKRIWKTVIAQFVLLVIFSLTASACPACRVRVKSGIYDQSFGANLFVMLLPIVVIVAVGIGLYYADEITDKIKKGASRWQTTDDVAR